MYKIKKTIHCDTKPTWMVCLLYKIPPTVYDWQDSTDACKKRLTIIKKHYREHLCEMASWKQKPHTDPSG